MSNPNRRCWHVDEFCEAHRIGRTTFYKEVKAGRLTIVKVGNRTLIRVEDGEAWLDAHLVGGETDD